MYHCHNLNFQRLNLLKRDWLSVATKLTNEAMENAVDAELFAK